MDHLTSRSNINSLLGISKWTRIFVSCCCKVSVCVSFPNITFLDLSWTFLFQFQIFAALIFVKFYYWFGLESILEIFFSFYFLTCFFIVFFRFIKFIFEDFGFCFFLCFWVCMVCGVCFEGVFLEKKVDFFSLLFFRQRHDWLPGIPHHDGAEDEGHGQWGGDSRGVPCLWQGRQRIHLRRRTAPRHDQPGRETDGRGGGRDDPGGGHWRGRPGELRGICDNDDEPLRRCCGEGKMPEEKRRLQRWKLCWLHSCDVFILLNLTHRDIFFFSSLQHTLYYTQTHTHTHTHTMF